MKKISPKAAIAALFILALFSLSYAQNEEHITITTYYPSPFGSYRDLTVARDLRLETDPNNPANDGPQIEWRTSSDPNSRHWNIDQVGDRLRFFTEDDSNGAGQERVTILENGNVGVGETNPTYNLEVRSDNNNVARLISTADGDTNILVVESQGGSGQVKIINRNPNSGGGAVELMLDQETAPFGNKEARIIFQQDGIDSWLLAQHQFFGGRYGFGIYENFPTSQQVALYVTPGRRVGIGTEQPQGTLEVSHNMTAGAHDLVVDGTTGFVGIGRVNPPSILTIGPMDTQNNGAEVRFLGAGGNRYFYLDNLAGRLRFVSQDDGTVESEKVTILNNGNVGIGTPAPTLKLVVEGKVKFNAGGTPNAAICWMSDGATLGSCATNLTESGTCICVGSSQLGEGTTRSHNR